MISFFLLFKYDIEKPQREYMKLRRHIFITTGYSKANIYQKNKQILYFGYRAKILLKSLISFFPEEFMIKKSLFERLKYSGLEEKIKKSEHFTCIPRKLLISRKRIMSDSVKNYKTSTDRLNCIIHKFLTIYANFFFFLVKQNILDPFGYLCLI